MEKEKLNKETMIVLQKSIDLIDDIFTIFEGDKAKRQAAILKNRIKAVLAAHRKE